jgi:hypothetical protein
MVHRINQLKKLVFTGIRRIAGKQETGKGLDRAEPARLDGMQPEEVEARRSRSREGKTCSSSEPPRQGVVGSRWRNRGSAPYPAARARDPEAAPYIGDGIEVEE